MGGAINITSARSDFEFESYVEALYEPEAGEQLYTGVISGGLSDSVAGRLAVRYEGMDGWWDNTELNKEGPDKENLYIRGTLLWDASDTVEVLAKYEHGDFDVANKPPVIYGATCTVPQATDPENNPGCLADDGSNIAPGGKGGQDLSGDILLFAPQYSASINAQWIVPVGDTLEIRTNADVNYTDEFYSALDLDRNTKHDAVTRLNMRIALASVDDTWSLALVGKNLTDEKTLVWKNDVALTNSNSYFGVPERPRSIAVQARYRF